MKTARLDALQEANVVQIEKSELAVKVRYDEWDSAEFDEYHPLYCISLQSTNQVLRSIPEVGTDIYVRAVRALCLSVVFEREARECQF